jgi:nanoRNase/pAp phosphatase (c-di-AMP/oligoRNAs hydrolase)
MIYALYPDTNISIHLLWGLKKQNTVFAIGKSIVNRTSKTSVGSLCLIYGGGGHENAGTCQVEVAATDTVMNDLIAKINGDG